MSEALMLPPSHEDQPIAPPIRLGRGLLGAPGPDTLVTVGERGMDNNAPGSRSLVPSPSVGHEIEAVIARLLAQGALPALHPGVEDLRESLETLHDLSQLLLGTLSAVAQAPRELETVVAMSSYRWQMLSEQLEDSASRAVAAAGEVRAVVLAETAAHREVFADTAVSLVDRIEDAERNLSEHKAQLVEEMDAARAALNEDLERAHRLLVDRTRRGADKIRECSAEVTETMLAVGAQVVTEISAQVTRLREERLAAEAALGLQRRRRFSRA